MSKKLAHAVIFRKYFGTKFINYNIFLKTTKELDIIFNCDQNQRKSIQINSNNYHTTR